MKRLILIQPFVSLLALLLCLLFAFTVSCTNKSKQAQFLPPSVGVVQSIRHDYPVSGTFPAQVTGSLEIQIRAQVGGILKERNFIEGQFVTEGTQLFLIDPKPYEIALAKAEAAYNQAVAQTDKARRDYVRMKELVDDGAVSRKQYDDALYTYQSMQASRQAAAALVDEAKVNLGYTRVTAPISGIVRKEAKSIGNLIAVTGDAGLLTTMVQIDPLHVNFSIPSTQIEAFSKGITSGAMIVAETTADQNGLKIEAILSDGSIFQQPGRIIFADSSEDVTTASVSFKAEFPNPAMSGSTNSIEPPGMQRKMMPGQFIRIRISGIVLKDAVLVPSSALVKSGTNTVVYVVGEGNVVQAKPVTVTESGNIGIISGGLEGGETVITEGVLKARPGMAVNPTPREFSL